MTIPFILVILHTALDFLQKKSNDVDVQKPIQTIMVKSGTDVKKNCFMEVKTPSSGLKWVLFITKIGLPVMYIIGVLGFFSFGTYLKLFN